MVVKQDKVPFEDALRMAGFGKSNLVSFMLCSSVIMGMAFEIFSVSYLVPASACELGTTSAQQGIMAAFPLVGIILTSHVWGYLADSLGRRRILMVSMSLSFVAGALAAFSPNWIVLSVLKLCSSACVSGAYAMALTLMSESTVMERRSLLVLLTTTVFLVCTGVMAVVSLPVLSLGFSYPVPWLGIRLESWRLLALLFTVPCAAGALGLHWADESPKYLLGAGRHDEALRVLGKIFAMNSGKSADLYRVGSVVLDEEAKAAAAGFWSSVKAQTLPLLRMPLLKDTLLLSVLMFIVYVCINPYQVWMPFIVNALMTSVEKGSADLTLCQMMRESRNSTLEVQEPTDCSMNQFAMTVVFSMSLVIAALNLVVSGVTHYVGRKALFIALQVSGGAAAIYINFSHSWVVSAGCFMLYLTGIINYATLASYCVEVYPTYVKAMAVCLTLMVGRGSAIVSINVVKDLLDNNCEAGFYIFGSIYLAGGFIALLLPTDKQIVDRKEYLKTKITNMT